MYVLFACVKSLRNMLSQSISPFDGSGQLEITITTLHHLTPSVQNVTWTGGEKKP